MSESASIAKVAPGADIRLGDASKLPWPDASFDIVLQSTVFTSILEESLRQAVAEELLRVLRPGGIILWYDFFVNNPKNSDVRGISRREIIDLFPGSKVSSARITLAPPLARFLAPCSRVLCEVLAGLRILDTHLLAVISKPCHNL